MGQKLRKHLKHVVILTGLSLNWWRCTGKNLRQQPGETKSPTWQTEKPNVPVHLGQKLVHPKDKTPKHKLKTNMYVMQCSDECLERLPRKNQSAHNTREPPQQLGIHWEWPTLNKGWGLWHQLSAIYNAVLRFKRPLSIVHTMMPISYTGFTLTWSILGQWQSGVKNLGLSLGCFRTEEAFWMRGNIFTNQKETRLPSLQLSSLQIVFRLWGNSRQQDQ